MERPTYSPPPAARPRIGAVTILAIIAFAVGIALMLVAMRNSGGWFVRTAAPAAPPAATAQPAAAPAPMPAVDLATLATRERALAAQLTVLEARAAAIDQQTAQAAAQAGRAEGMMIAFATRRAIDRGVSLGYLEEQLRLRFGTVSPAAVAAVIRAGRDPVTLAALRQALDANADLLTTGGDGWLAGLSRELENLVVLHDSGTPSPLPVDRLARARRLLDAGQVAASRAEIGRLPGAARAVNWSSAAQRWIAAHDALDAIEAAAVNGATAARRAPAGAI